MSEELPFAVSSRPWEQLSEYDRCFFCGDHYLPLHPHHAAQIRLLNGDDARRLSSWVWSIIPPGWPDQPECNFEHEAVLNIMGRSWGDEATQVAVRRWLYERGIPFRRTVYLLYEPHRVVQTTWRMVVRYWDAFAWSVGFAMVAVDHTLRWAVCFHHEDVFVFGSHQGLCLCRPAASKRG
ncbi:MAG: hypothetical protein JNM56_03070 [Planctomycetia bacterium]|nr:hypothetical protein [Planctomycetia bacterium]